MLDVTAVEQAMIDDPDAALGLLAELTGATDPVLRRLSLDLAVRMMLDVARRGSPRPGGTGRLVEQPVGPDGGDLDVEASLAVGLDVIAVARVSGRAVDPEVLRVRTWATPSTGLCLLIDRSGSMSGAALATAAMTAAAVAWRAPQDHSVVAFARSAVVLRSQDVPRPTGQVVDGVLALRGVGTTDLAGALRVAADQLARSSAARKITILLSDGRATEPGDVVAAASALDELVIVAPAGDDHEARDLAVRTGAAFTTVAGPIDAPAAITRVMSP